MNAPASNPYAAPDASVAEESDARGAVAPRWWSVILLAFALGTLAGAIFVASTSFGLRRFGGGEYVPLIVFLAATRVLAGGPAAVAALLLGVRALHRASSTKPPDGRRMSAAWPLVATLGATIPSYVGMLVGSIGASAVDGIAATLYVDAARTLALTDPLVGIAYASLDGALAAGVVYFAHRAWRSTQWALAGKWIVAFVLLRIAAAGVSALLAFVGVES